MPQNPSDKLISVVMSMRRLIQDRMKNSMQANFFSFTQMEILRYVADKKNPLMKEVAEYLNITPPSATALINNLVEAGKLRRINDKQDRRIVRLVITLKGLQTLKKNIHKMRAEMKKVFSRLNKGEINSLIKIYEKLAKVLKSK